MPIKLLALILPLSLDTFAVSAALGVAGLPRQQRVRLGILFACFEAGMPIVGVILGGLIARSIGDVADLVAIALLAGVGVWMLRDDDELPNDLVKRSRGVAALGLGLSISIDELAIGFTIGLLELPAVLIIALIAGQAFLATQLGSMLGQRVAKMRIFGEELNEQAERAAGAFLLLFAVVLLALRLTGHEA